MNFLRMADGPVANLPPGMDAYGGYTNHSGIGVTFPEVQKLAKEQNAIAFSFTTNGDGIGQCADVEDHAMSSWVGYDWGYCSVARVNELIKAFGRPKKLLTAHYDPHFGAHICGPHSCDYRDAQNTSLVTTADGTQWTNHEGFWDESLLMEDFFTLSPQPITIPEGEIMSVEMITKNGKEYMVTNVVAGGHLVQVTQEADTVGTPSNAQNTSIIDLTDQWPNELKGVTSA